MRLEIAAAVVACFASANSAAAQTTLKQAQGSAGTSGFGQSVDRAFDVDADGTPDVVAGAPFDDSNGTDAGMARVFEQGAALATLWTFHGEQPGDHFGWSVAGMGDVNADGFADVAVGAPDHDGVGADSGRAYVFSGKNGAVLYTFDGAAAGDRFGFCVANVGDVNGDGRNDLAVGAPMSNAGGADSGRVRVYSGGTGALFPTGTINGGAAGDRFGSAIATVGDVNGDGRPDFIAGAPFHSQGIAVEMGLATLYSGANFGALHTYTGLAGSRFGSSIAGLGSFLGGVHIAIGAPAAAGGTVSVLIAGTGALVTKLLGGVVGEEFGASVSSAGSLFTPTLHPLVAVGIPSFGAADNGAVEIFDAFDGTGIGAYLSAPPGARAGTSVANLGLLSGWSLSNGIAIGVPFDDGGRAVIVTSGAGFLGAAEGPLWGDWFGSSVAGIGDANGDGKGDWVVGSPRDDGPVKNGGSVKIYRGALNNPPLVLFGGETDADFGAAVAGAGDFNQDGRLDVIVGAPRHHAGPLADVGAIYLYSGATGVFQASISGTIAGDRFGSAVGGAGDANADGYDDFLVGVPMHDGVGADSGEARLISGLTGLPMFPPFQGDAAGDHFGAAVAGVGDVNLDGFPDVAIGAPLHSGLLSGGLVRVFSGKNGATLFTSSMAFVNGLGASVAAAGDVNGDGVPDVVAGAPTNDLGNPDTGAACVFSGVNGALLVSKLGTGVLDRLGASVAGLGDVNRDGFADWCAGADELFIFGSGAGFVNVYGGADGLLIHAITGTAAADGFGASVARVDDANGDGASELLVGAPYEDPNGLTNAGVARLITVAPEHVASYGSGTPGCSGTELLFGNPTPTVGNAAFKLTTQHSPPSSLSLALVCDAPQFTGFDTFGLGVLMHVNLLAASQIYNFDVLTDAFGHGATPLPIPNNPALSGVHVYAQVLSSWAAGPCVPSPFALSSSTGLDIQFQ